MHTIHLKERAFSLTFFLILSFILFPSIVFSTSSEDIKTNAQKGAEKIKEAVRLISNGDYTEAEAILLGLREDPVWHDRITFLLGRFYKEKGVFKDAEDFLKKSIEDLPLLKDYALFLLADVYKSNGYFKKAIETIKVIKNPLLLQDVRRMEFNALLAMNEDDEAIEILSQYIIDYPEDLESKFLLATLYKKHGINNLATQLFKDIYINASEFSSDALKMVKELKADVFTKGELLTRARNLFNNHDYQAAKETYERVLEELVDDKEREGIWYEIGMCQFRLKQYTEAAESFKRVKGDKALYMEARSLFRADDIEGFKRVVERFEREHPWNIYLSRLILISADDLRRRGRLEDAERQYEKLLENFQGMREDALWGLAWMHYSAGDYDKAIGYLLRLKRYTESASYYKYLYWWLRTCERLSGRCTKNNIFQDDKPSKYESYYWYLIMLRYQKDKPSSVSQGSISFSNGRNNPWLTRPDGEVYERIEALAMLGMREWAIREIKDAISRVSDRNEFLYLSHMAKLIGDYKTVIALTEEKKEEEFFTFSYPLGYWDTVEKVSKENGLDPYLVAAVIREESRFDPEAISWAGAVGLMQLMPETARRFSDHVDRDGLHDVNRNVLLGSHYLSMLIREFMRLPYALAAYNAGESALKKWLDKMENRDIDEFIEDIPYTETKRYVMKVLKSYWRYRTLYCLPLKGF